MLAQAASAVTLVRSEVEPDDTTDDRGKPACRSHLEKRDQARLVAIPPGRAQVKDTLKPERGIETILKCKPAISQRRLVESSPALVLWRATLVIGQSTTRQGFFVRLPQYGNQ